MSAAASRTDGAVVPGANARGTPAASSRPEWDVITGAIASVALRVECGREGFARARAFTRETLSQWSLAHRGDDAALVLTELAANAATHAVPFVPAAGADVWLGLALERTHVTLTVSDPCDDRPVPAAAARSEFEEHGRGLCIVDALAEEWGWAPRPPRGKTVWAKLSTRPSH